MSKVKTVKVKAPTLKSSSEIIGGHLSNVSKMPGMSWNLVAIKACPTGAKMAEIEGSACSGCYADGRGNYGFPNVRVALEKHLTTLEAAIDGGKETQDAWISAMVHLIGHYQPADEDRFRIHDSGDFISVEYYLMWCEIARRLPHLRFWAPTREVKIAKLAAMTAPSNLRVRYSINMMDHYPKPTAEIPYVSYIQNKVERPAGLPICPAPEQGNKCLGCDLCWSKAPASTYRKH
jgi:ferredoxin